MYDGMGNTRIFQSKTRGLQRLYNSARRENSRSCVGSRGNPSRSTQACAVNVGAGEPLVRDGGSGPPAARWVAQLPQDVRQVVTPQQPPSAHICSDDLPCQHELATKRQRLCVGHRESADALWASTSSAASSAGTEAGTSKSNV